MTLSEISNIRLQSQQLTNPEYKTIKKVVGWMGAMQAQDYAMAKWAIGIRLPNSTDDLIQAAVDTAEIIRTHLLRPTWHIVSSEDIYWLLELTSPHIKSSLKSRHKDLELSESLLIKCNKLLKKAMQGGNHLTREEIISKLHNAKIATNNNRTSHILLNAEIEGIVCSGAMKSKKQTYALLSERVTKTRTFTREESLYKIAGKYFLSHGPATLKDFAWWSGLPVGDARIALEMVKSEFIPERIGLETYWFTNLFLKPQTQNSNSYLLPAFDEFLISYKDRSPSLPKGVQKKAVSENGIFRPVIIIDGQVKGVWKRTIIKDKVIIEADFFRPCSKKTMIWFGKAAESYGSFLEERIDVIHNNI